MIARSRPLVLVADDEPDIRGLLSRALERAGYQVIAAGDGDEAFDLALEHLPALAVIDVVMPGRSGLELVRDLRRRAVTRSMPIILTSAHVREADLQLGHAAGADRYVTKPLSPRELITCVEGLLETGRREALSTT